MFLGRLDHQLARFRMVAELFRYHSETVDVNPNPRRVRWPMPPERVAEEKRALSYIGAVIGIGGPSLCTAP